MGAAEGGGVVSDYTHHDIEVAARAEVARREAAQRYSDRALAAARMARDAMVADDDTAMTVLHAAHDREALGLDASARVGDTLNEVVAWLREATVDTFCTSLPDDLLREFEANEGER